MRRAAFVSEHQIAAQWKWLNYSAPPDFSRALEEYDRFIEIIRSTAAEIVYLPQRSDVNLDSIYTRDASVLGADGVILCSMGKPARTCEPAAQEQDPAHPQIDSQRDPSLLQACSKGAISSGSMSER